MNPESLAGAIPGLASVGALTWLLARTFLRAEDRHDTEYERMIREIERKDETIHRLEARLQQQKEKFDASE